jgi:hypothetical protein
MKTQVITFNPWLYNELGHSLIYTKAIEKAAKLNDWDFFAMLPMKCTLDSLPQNWEKNIGCPTVRHWFEEIEGRAYRRPRKIVRARERFYYYYSAAKGLRKYLITKRVERTILFLEAFAQTDVQLLANLLRFLPKKNLSIWLIHRYQASTLKSDISRYELYHKQLLRMGIDLKLLTDSELLKEDLEPHFKLPMTVLPIHYVEKSSIEEKKKNERIISWWPGVIREGKGLKIIENFAASSAPSNALIDLVVNKNCILDLHAKSPKVIFLENHLSALEYHEWMDKSDVILLPYCDPHYEKATSSIFIEAIVSGKVPFVYPKTWMAYELKKYDLNELILDWNPSTLSQQILAIVENKKVLDKLKSLKAHYEEFHILKRYAEILKELTEPS